MALQLVHMLSPLTVCDIYMYVGSSLRLFPNTPVESSRVESSHVESSPVESSFPTLKSKGAKLHLLGFFGLSMYWYLQTVLQRSIYLERTSRAILHHKLGDVKNF